MTEELVALETETGRRVELRRDGQAASWANLYYHTLRVGRARLSAGGVGDVATRRDCRRRGYNRRVMERAVEVMTGDGLDVALLFGIADYYTKFGFRTCLGDYVARLPGREVIDGPMDLRPRRIRESRRHEILPLYRRDLERRGFGIERRKGRWRGFARGVHIRRGVVLTGFHRGKQLVGYAVCDDDPKAVRVGELAARDAEALRSMATWLGRECRRRVCETIELHLPPHHPASRLAAECDAELVRSTRRTGGGMMRVLNLGSTVSALLPELAARWEHSPLAARGLDLTLRTDLDTAELALGARDADAELISGTVRLGQDRLAQLITGIHPPSHLAACGDLRIPTRLLPAIENLFPQGHPTVLATNCF